MLQQDRRRTTSSSRRGARTRCASSCGSRSRPSTSIGNGTSSSIRGSTGRPRSTCSSATRRRRTACSGWEPEVSFEGSSRRMVAADLDRLRPFVAPCDVRVLVTGARGFVGRHLTAALRERGHEVVRDRSRRARRRARGRRHRRARGAWRRSTSRDPTPSRTSRRRPSCPRRCAIRRRRSTSTRAARCTCSKPPRALAGDGAPSRVLVVSSADVYGAQPPDAYPLRETRGARAAQPVRREQSGRRGARVGVRALVRRRRRVTRAFNHIGPGQDERFARRRLRGADRARRRRRTSRSCASATSTRARDVLDVRDVCDAYVLLLEGGGEAGEIYNVCSGTATPMREILRRLIEIARVPVEVRDDPGAHAPGGRARSASATRASCAPRPAGRRASRWAPRCAPSTRTPRAPERRIPAS